MSVTQSIASPCIGVCIMDRERGHCRGCYRTLAEISSWLQFTPADRGAVLAVLERRRANDESAPTGPIVAERNPP